MATEWTKPMEWNATGSEPSDTLKTSGFKAGDKPPADVFNYFLNSTYESISQLQEVSDTKSDQGHTHTMADVSETTDKKIMTSAERTKLSGIATGANKYTHPSYTAKSSGLYKVTVDATGHVSATTAVAKSDITALGIPSSDTTYSAATTETAGLMSAADKTKLDGIATGANKYSLPSAGSSLGGVKTGGDVTISNGLITVNDDSHNHTIANVDGLQDALDGLQDDIDANAYTLPTASSSTLGGVKTTSTVTSTSGLTACPIISGVPYYKDTNSTYSNATLGQGYGTCTTAAATAAKVVTLSGYTLTNGGVVSVKFTYAVPANATMNINSKGAKAIFYKGAAITANVIYAGDIATFIYDGTQYHLIALDRLKNASASSSGYMSYTHYNQVENLSHIWSFEDEGEGERSYCYNSPENNCASGDFSNAFNSSTTADGANANAFGESTTASGSHSVAFGLSTEASGNKSAAFGGGTTASGSHSVAFGLSTEASGNKSAAFGGGTTASGNDSVAFGFGTTASQSQSAAFGCDTTANGAISTTFGNKTTASGYTSFAQGEHSVAKGDTAVALNFYTIANENQTVVGRANIEKSGASASPNDDEMYGDDYGNWESGGSLFIVGNGYYEENIDNTFYDPSAGDAPEYRRNAFRVDDAGRCYGLKTFVSSGADLAEFFEYADGNENKEDRRGLMVTLEGEKIRLANAGDRILGIVSAVPSYIGDSASEEWQNRFLTDVFGNTVYETREIPEKVNEETGETIPAKTVRVPVLNPEFDPEATYIPRENRKEWATIGLIGKVVAVDDGTCKVGEFCTVGKNGVATYSADETKFYCMKRLDDTHIKVFVGNMG